MLCHCKVNTLVLVYLPEKQHAILQNTKIQKFLSEEGYELGDSQKMLKQLGDKIVRSHSFPHEIGIFLGYPLEDIVGFIENKGKNWKHNDYWKVYGDEVEAKKLFKKYNDCRNHLMQAVADGIPLHLAVKSA